MYDLVKKCLFCLSPELSHELALDWLGAAGRLGLLDVLYDVPSKPVSVMGLNFPNPVGLAAGLDKNGDYFNALGKLGFGFVEIGTITPKAQPGNPAPRLFRLPQQEAIINRMGFNNLGLEHLVEQVKRRKYSGILGINIGKNKLTPDDDALQDYRICLQQVYGLADYVTVNISSPNTPGLRSLQFGEPLDHLLKGIQECDNTLADQHGKRTPIAVKIAPDMAKDDVKQVADSLVKHGMSAVIATNTTISRDAIKHHPLSGEAGGLSGRPVKELSDRVIHILKEHLQGEIPIIGVGGILGAQDVKDKVSAGADLVQIYSGFIYKGPGLIKQAVEAF